MRHGMNSEEMQRNNRTAVIKTLIEKKSMTRTALSELMGLQKATITNIINELMALNIVGIDGESASGRRGEKIFLKVRSINILSIVLTRKDYQVGTFSLDGDLQEYRRYLFEENEDIADIIGKLKQDIVYQTGKYGRDTFVGACIAVPGPFIRYASGDYEFRVAQFEQLSRIDLKKELESVLPVELLMKHDAKLGAFAEWKNSEEIKKDSNASLMLVRSRGYGIGAGMVIGGKIIEGQLGIAGEVGHVGIDYSESRTREEFQGTLEFCAGSESAVRYARERLYEFPDSILNKKSTYQDLLSAYRQGDPLAVCAMDKMAWMLGYGISNFVYMVNPDCVIIGPDYPDDERFIANIKRVVSQRVDDIIWKNMVIRYSELKIDSFLLGGYCYILEKLCREKVILEKIKEVVEKAS